MIWCLYPHVYYVGVQFSVERNECSGVHSLKHPPNVQSKQFQCTHISVFEDSSYLVHPFEQVSLAIENRPSFLDKAYLLVDEVTCELSTNKKMMCMCLSMHLNGWMCMCICDCDCVNWLVFSNSFHIFDGKCCVYNKRVEERVYVCMCVCECVYARECWTTIFCAFWHVNVWVWACKRVSEIEMSAYKYYCFEFLPNERSMYNV